VGEEEMNFVRISKTECLNVSEIRTFDVKTRETKTPILETISRDFKKVTAETKAKTTVLKIETITGRLITLSGPEADAALVILENPE
jgi:hypothetical protein